MQSNVKTLRLGALFPVGRCGRMTTCPKGCDADLWALGGCTFECARCRERWTDYDRVKRHLDAELQCVELAPTCERGRRRTRWPTNGLL